MILATRTPVLTLTCPLTDIAGQPLSAEPLIAVIYRLPSQVVAANVCYPGEIISTEVPGEYGCWVATAWLIGRLESGNSERVCKQAPVTDFDCSDCHQ